MIAMFSVLGFPPQNAKIHWDFEVVSPSKKSLDQEPHGLQGSNNYPLGAS